MNKIIVTILFLCMFCLPLIAAEENIISNTTYGNNALLDLEIADYTVSIGAGNVTSMQLSRTNETLILSEGDCKKFNSEKLCYEEKATETTVRLVIYDLKATMHVQLEGETDTYTAGDELNITIIMNNSGEREAEKIFMILALPENVTVEENEDCEHNATHIYWQGTIQADDEETCHVTLKFTGVVDKKIKAILNYTTFATLLSAESDDLTLKAEQNFDYVITISSITNLEPEEPFTINISITNNDEDCNLSIEELLIEHNGDLQLVKTNFTKLRERTTTLKLTQSIENETTLKGYVQLQSPYIDKEGTFKITFSYNTTKDATLRSFTEEYYYKTKELPLQITTEPTDLTFESLETTEIKLWVVNPYKYLTFKGYEVTITSSLAERELVKVPYGTKKHITTVEYQLPDILTKQKELIVVDVLAKTDQDQITSHQEKLELLILPLQGITLNTTTTTTDNITTILLRATNNHQQPVTVTFNDIMPEGIFANGITTRILTLESQQPTKIYEYKITTTNKESTANIQTTYQYNYLEKDINELVTTTIKNLSPKQPKVIIQNTTQEPIITETEATEITRQNPSLVHIIIATSILLLFVLIGVSWQWIKHIHVFKIQHKKILRSYQELLSEGELLRKRKQELQRDQEDLQKKMYLLEHQITHYEEELPKKITLLDTTIQRDQTSAEKLHEAKESMDSLKKRVAEKEQLINEKELLFNEHLQKIEAEKKILEEDDKLLHEDAKTLKDEQEKIVKELELVDQNQQQVAKRIGSFKNKHVSLVHNKITMLSKQKKELLHYHNKIIEEEDLIKKEFEKMQHDLDISKEELKRAEKIYKQTTIEQNKQENELEKKLN